MIIDTRGAGYLIKHLYLVCGNTIMFRSACQVEFVLREKTLLNSTTAWSRCSDVRETTQFCQVLTTTRAEGIENSLGLLPSAEVVLLT